MHRVSELVLRYIAVATSISLFEQLCPYLRVHASAAIGAEYVIEVVHTDLAVLVVVQYFEGLVNFLGIVESLSIYASRDKLLEVYTPVTVLVKFRYDLVPVDIIVLEGLMNHFLQV